MKVVFDTDLKLRLPKLGECTVRDDKDTLLTCPPDPSNIVTEFDPDSIRRFAFI
jgi:hypothetical protein